MSTDVYIQIKNFYADLAWKEQVLNPIQYAAWTHAEFVRIHPFIDGNGRTSRLIMNYQLMSKGFLPISIAKEKQAGLLQCFRRVCCKWESKSVCRFDRGFGRNSVG